MPAKTLYYPVWVTPNRKAGLSWGPACETAREADIVVRERIADGAVFAVVVEFRDGEKKPMIHHIRPASSQAAVEHWEKVWDATEDEQ